MNLQQMRSLRAILENNSFSAAADKVGLSHSAISLQIRNLEQEFGQVLFDRSTRPATLTPVGRRTAIAAQKALKLVENVRLVGSGQQEMDLLTFGIVPTETQFLLPVILRELQDRQPRSQIKVKSGLSGHLAFLVRNMDLDFAILTAPLDAVPELQVHELVTEPLFVIANPAITAQSDVELLRSHPFIAFENMTWMGHQVSARLQSRGIAVNEIMEVDSLDAIQRMVAEGFGISIVPQRFMAPPLSERFTVVPFCDPQETRRLVLIFRTESDNEAQVDTVRQILDGLVSP